MRRALASTLAVSLVGALLVLDVVEAGPGPATAVAPTETRVPLSAASATTSLAPGALQPSGPTVLTNRWVPRTSPSWA